MGDKEDLEEWVNREEVRKLLEEENLGEEEKGRPSLEQRMPFGVYESGGRAYEMVIGPGADFYLGPSWMHYLVDGLASKLKLPNYF